MNVFWGGKNTTKQDVKLTFIVKKYYHFVTIPFVQEFTVYNWDGWNSIFLKRLFFSPSRVSTKVGRVSIRQH